MRCVAVVVHASRGCGSPSCVAWVGRGRSPALLLPGSLPSSVLVQTAAVPAQYQVERLERRRDFRQHRVRRPARPDRCGAPRCRRSACSPADLRVSPATVAKAYAELRRRGMVEADGRRGTRVRSRPAVAAARSALRLPVPAGVLDLSAGRAGHGACCRRSAPDLRLRSPTGSGRRSGMRRPARCRSSSTPPGRGWPRTACPIDDAAITVTAGALDAIERLLTVHLRPGDAVAVEDPGWANLFDLLAALGLRAVPMAVDDEGPTRGVVAPPSARAPARSSSPPARRTRPVRRVSAAARRRAARRCSPAIRASW